MLGRLFGHLEAQLLAALQADPALGLLRRLDQLLLDQHFRFHLWIAEGVTIFAALGR